VGDKATEERILMRLGNAPVSWGVFEANRPNPPFETVLDQIAASGYLGTELGPYGYLPTDPARLDNELGRRRLALASSFVPLALEDGARREAAVQKALTVARLLASRGVEELIISAEEKPARARIAGRVPKDGTAGYGEREWKEVAVTVHAVARALHDELGMRVVVHHHAGTHIESEQEIERLLFETDPELVALLLDTGHAVYGGGDPVELIERYGPRVRYVHLKDASQTEIERVRSTSTPMDEAWRRGVFCPLGEGVVDFPRVIEALAGRGYGGWLIVEQDVVPGANGKLHPDPFESARKSREYLRTLGL
jgi:inosose dehydratase